VGWLAPAIGALFGLLPGFVTQIENVYTESVLFLWVAMAIGFLSPSLAVSFILSYGVGDLLLSLPYPPLGSWAG